MSRFRESDFHIGCGLEVAAEAVDATIPEHFEDRPKHEYDGGVVLGVGGAAQGDHL